MKVKESTRATLRGCFAIFMACCGLAPMGHLATLANMTPYLASYMHEHADTKIDYTQVIWLSCCLHLIQGISTPITTALLPYVNYRILLLIAWVVQNLGVVLTGVTLKVGFGAVIFTYAIMVGWGVGGAYGLVLSMASSWFPKHRGLVVGICACGFGAGAIILTPIQTLAINPQNLAVNNETQMFDNAEMLERVPKYLYVIGGVMAGLQLISFLLVSPRPEEEKGYEFEAEESAESSQEAEGTMEKGAVMETDLPPSKVLRKVDLYLFWTIMGLSLIPLTLINVTVKVVGQRSIPDDKYLSGVSTFGAAFNTISRIAWGPVGDKFSYKVPLICLNLLYSVVLITLPFIPPIPTAGKYLYAVWVILIYLCVAGNFIMLPLGISRAFGHKFFAANYGLVFSAFVPGSIIGALIVYFVKLEQHLTDIFVACGFITCGSSIIALFLDDSKSPKFIRGITCHRRR